jgi:hypothetical protein
MIRTTKLTVYVNKIILPISDKSGSHFENPNFKVHVLFSWFLNIIYLKYWNPAENTVNVPVVGHRLEIAVYLTVCILGLISLYFTTQHGFVLRKNSTVLG